MKLLFVVLMACIVASIVVDWKLRDNDSKRMPSGSSTLPPVKAAMPNPTTSTPANPSTPVGADATASRGNAVANVATRPVRMGPIQGSQL